MTTFCFIETKHVIRVLFAAKRRRETANFPGAAIILKHIQDGVKKKRVGFIADKGRPLRSQFSFYR